MDNSQLDKLIKFAEQYGEGKVFRSGDIRWELICYLASDNCLWCEENGEITAILCYEIPEYFPLTVTICELVCSEPKAMVEILEQFADRMPPDFKLCASRKLSTKTVDYKNPRRILKLIQTLYGSRPLNPTPEKVLAFSS